MPWRQVGATQGRNKKEYQGIASIDGTKPTDCGNGSTCYEIDTKKGWIYDIAKINPATGDHWWPV